MPTSADVGEAVATIVVVIGAHLKTQQVSRHHAERCQEQLRALRHDLGELRDRLGRWSGLP